MDILLISSIQEYLQINFLFYFYSVPLYCNNFILIEPVIV